MPPRVVPAAEMVRAWLRRQRARVVEELHRSLVDEPEPEHVARSFSIGAFITMLPTLGFGLGLFVVLAYTVSWINKIALLASVVVFNPVVKWGVYVASFSLGVLILGPIDGVSMSEVSIDAGGPILVRLLVGNLILAVLAALVAYVAAYRFVIAFEESNVGEALEDALDELAEDTDQAA